MHYHAQVWIPDLTDIEQHVEKAMESHRENWDVEPHAGFWDWYQIGGRYTGRHSIGYDPNADPRNHETCKMCGGTGFRRDAVGVAARIKTPSYTCNGCGEWDDATKTWKHGKQGAGKAVKWPTDWAQHGNIAPVGEASPELKAYTLLVNGTVLHKEQWNGKDWVDTGWDGMVKPKLNELGVKDGYLVTVDYHS